MSTASVEHRHFRVERTRIDDEQYLQLTVIDDDARLVTRDHFTINEARSLAAEVILAVEG